MNKSSNNINTDFPTLENGFSFITWIKIEKELIDTYFLVHKTDENNFITLINIDSGGHQIKLQLADVNNITKAEQDNLSSNISDYMSNTIEDEINQNVEIIQASANRFKESLRNSVHADEKILKFAK